MRVLNSAIIFVSLSYILGGCQEVWRETPISDDELGNLEDAVIGEEFDYKTTQEMDLQITALDNDDNPLSNVLFSVYYQIDSSKFMQNQGISAQNGKVQLSLSLPSFVEEVWVETSYIGLPRTQAIPVVGGYSAITIGGRSAQTSGRIKASGTVSNARQQVSSPEYLSGYDSDGVPNNLLPNKDYISQDLLDMINTTLPERFPVPTYNPEYLNSELIADTQLQDSAEVWVTFVHEGAGWRNALGYYTYTLNNPPQSVDDISDFHIIFPNVSFPNEGGNLESGSKISLGNYPPNTGIGWFLLPDAWNGTEAVVKSQVKYSNKNFNTFTSESFRQHTVLLKDDVRKLLLLGMEDTSRPGGDNDFNDAVFYITASPFEALVTGNLGETKTEGEDSDGDGIADFNDAYPNDADKAFNIYAPAENTYGSIAFEDNWPAKGDYDMNDVVIEYNYQFVSNASNEVVEVIAQYQLIATGAEFNNGFGIEFPLTPAQITSAALKEGASSSISIEAEAGQDQAVFIIFENAHQAIGTSGPVNTIPNKESMEVVPFELRLSLSEPVSMSQLGYAPFNPFIFVDGDRSREVHLADYKPTNQANNQLFGSIHDASNASNARYYKSKTNLPWAIHVPFSFAYPKEYTSINAAYRKFIRWAESSGTEFSDWYQDKSGYRDKNNLYQK